ncbi:hypothetical protein MXZ82_06040 [Streptococcus uberis]|uniref:hypothetical protein n=1 Tax=Streptococcus uberis TaxID=1349 RepID=UPI001FF41407|nr:hypothetical protein [Streptococcus uberis]MCK1161877.1 hypothetical protein [Streptococcus uberis]
MKIYFASPLFTEMEVTFNQVLVEKIRQTYPDVEVFLPQEQGDINDKNAYADSKLNALKTVAESQFGYVNLYTVGLIKLNGKIVSSSQDLLQAIAEFL